MNCELCGRVPITDSSGGAFAFCPSCTLYACQECWNVEALTCTSCAAKGGVSSGTEVALHTAVAPHTAVPSSTAGSAAGVATGSRAPIEITVAARAAVAIEPAAEPIAPAAVAIAPATERAVSVAATYPGAMTTARSTTPSAVAIPIPRPLPAQEPQVGPVVRDASFAATIRQSVGPIHPAPFGVPGSQRPFVRVPPRISAEPVPAERRLGAARSGAERAARILRSVAGASLNDLPFRLALGAILAVSATFLYAHLPSPTLPAGTTATSTPKASSPPPAGASASVVTTYRVRPGDTLRSIAVRFYGDESMWQRIYRANRDRMDPDNLRIGMLIDIPPLDPR